MKTDCKEKPDVNLEGATILSLIFYNRSVQMSGRHKIGTIETQNMALVFKKLNLAKVVNFTSHCLVPSLLFCMGYDRISNFNSE